LSLSSFLYPVLSLRVVFEAMLDVLRCRASLQMELLALRHQLTLWQRSVKRPKLTAGCSGLHGQRCGRTAIPHW
jgi:hypothetical protein